MGSNGFYWLLPSFTGFSWVILGFTGFYWFFLGFNEFYQVLLVFLVFFSGFYLVFTGFYWVLLGPPLLRRSFTDGTWVYNGGNIWFLWVGTDTGSTEATCSLPELPVMPPSGTCQSLTVQSSEPEAMTLSLNGFHLMSSTGPVWPVTLPTVRSSRPVCSSGRTMKAPPPATYQRHPSSIHSSLVAPFSWLGGSAASRGPHLGDDGQELGVDGAAVGVVGVFGDLDVLVAAVLARHLAEDVPELGGPHAAERQLPKRTRTRNAIKYHRRAKKKKHVAVPFFLCHETTPHEMDVRDFWNALLRKKNKSQQQQKNRQLDCGSVALERKFDVYGAVIHLEILATRPLRLVEQTNPSKFRQCRSVLPGFTGFYLVL